MITAWIEIPANDVARALKFYQAVFQLGDIEIVDDGVRRTATLVNPPDEGMPGVSLNQTKDFPPSSTGVLVWFSAGSPAEMDAHIARAEAAGGVIVQARLDLGGYYYASFRDTEGNTIALSAA